MDKDIRFVTGEPALLIGKTLVVSDLHIGVEHRYRKKGIRLPSQSGRMLERLKELVSSTRAERLIVLGDIKDEVPGTSFQEKREIPAFFQRLLELGKVELTPGNHDGGVKELLPPKVRVHPSGGFMVGKTWLCHGHAWPPEGFLKAEHVVIGHYHAGIGFRDGLGYRWTEPVWVRTGLERKRIAKRYGDLPDSLPELIMMPMFNEFGLSMILNRPLEEIERYYKRGQTPLLRAAQRDSARVYMLDGTLLGELGDLKK